MEITFTIPGKPVGKGRPRVTRNGTYTPKKTKEYEALVKRCWREQSGEGFAGGVPLAAHITAFFPVPKSVSKKKAAAMDGTLCLTKPDCDNIAKGVLDALNGLAYQDDSAVMLGSVIKFYTTGEPRTHVIIRQF